jgi:hypothetical protein
MTIKPEGTSWGTPFLQFTTPSREPMPEPEPEQMVRNSVALSIAVMVIQNPTLPESFILHQFSPWRKENHSSRIKLSKHYA